MASRIPDVLASASAAITAERRDLAETERHRTAALGEQLEVATTLSRSRQLSAELNSVADDAVRNQHVQAGALQAAIDERRTVLDRITTDLTDLLGDRPLP